MSDYLLQKAIKAWKSPDWSPYYRQVGYVRLAKSEAKQASIQQDFDYFHRPESSPSSREQLDQSLSKLTLDTGLTSVDLAATSSQLWFPPSSFHRLSTPSDVILHAPQLSESPFSQNLAGYINTHGGYALASQAIEATYHKCLELGVQFILGPDGHITSLVKSSNTTSKASSPGIPVIGVESCSGTRHLHPQAPSHSLTILCVGAHLPQLLPSTSTPITAKAWSVAHLELTESEARSLSSVPVMNISELGFWMEPIFVTKKPSGTESVTPISSVPQGSANGTYLLKLCAHGGGWTNFSKASLGKTSQDSSKISIPTYSLTPPESDLALIRTLIRLTLPPTFHTKPFTRTSICWCADTPSSDYIIDFVPGYKDLLVVGADSGHAFKMMPLVGSWALNVVRRGQQEEARWKWKDEREGMKGGQEIKWRVGKCRDLEEAVVEKSGVEGARL